LESVLREALRTSLAGADDSRYKPLFTLSGGLDSRAVCALARDLGISPLVTWNLAEPGSIEQRLAAQAAEVLQAQHHSLAYDKGYWIINLIDAAVEAGDGMHHFIDSARMLYALPGFHERGFGVLHTGMSGDFLFGSFLTAEDLDEKIPTTTRADLLDGITHRLCMGLWRGLELLQDEAGDRAAFVSAVRASLDATLDEFHGDGRSRALEMWNLRNRQVRGIFGYYRGAEAYMEYSSPFYDPEVFRFAFQLPLADRCHERLYLKVLKEQILPRELAEIPWAKTGMPIVEEASLLTSLRRVLLQLRKRVLRPLSGEVWRRSSANPYHYWFWKNKDLRHHVRDQLVEIDHPEIFFLKRKDLIRFLDDWCRRPTRYGESLLHLLYLLAAVRWLELHRDQVDF
jgi:asparagine synthetase B (glutamine-hydrolysing)